MPRIKPRSYRRFSSTAPIRNWRFSAFSETFVLVESSGIFSNFSAESQPLLQAAKRYRSAKSNKE